MMRCISSKECTNQTDGVRQCLLKRILPLTVFLVALCVVILYSLTFLEESISRDTLLADGQNNVSIDSIQSNNGFIESESTNDQSSSAITVIPHHREKRKRIKGMDLSLSAHSLPRCIDNGSQNTSSILITHKKVPIIWSEESDYNLVYIKVEKVGGSTVSGVVRGIAQKLKLHGVHENFWIYNEPGVWAAHTKMCVLKPMIEDLKQSTFLMTWIREPAERALSHFYHFPVSRHNVTPTDQHIFRYLQDPRGLNINHQFGYISISNGRDPEESVLDIMRQYDFIGITESMLVLAHRLGLEIEDILYVKAKDSHRLKVDNKGFHFVPSIPVRYQSQAVQRYLKTEWFDLNAMDYLLWDMVNEEMDRMIAEIDGFDGKLRRYQLLLEKVEDQCGDLPNDKIDCLLGDEGCGQKCIRKVVYQQKESKSAHDFLCGITPPVGWIYMVLGC